MQVHKNCNFSFLLIIDPRQTEINIDLYSNVRISILWTLGVHSSSGWCYLLHKTTLSCFKLVEPALMNRYELVTNCTACWPAYLNQPAKTVYNTVN